ncbi:NRDE family protein [Psychrobacter aestuarii]|uniref:NRDE family protein n=1 Tax=Psychrobacter aestuarii TaxID=556327 RepID=A0ABP3FSI8_9GAMM|nr:NRDE family protein [Psychrobacter aestuarii]
MCIVAIAWQLFDELPLVLLSNRDEFFQRPTKSLHQWSDQPIYAGRDEKSGGTWLGIHQQPLAEAEAAGEHSTVYQQNGRWAAVLNFRDGVQANSQERSRGELVTHFLTSALSPMAFARQIDLQQYAGFNLIVGDAGQAVMVNNRGHAPTPLYAGLHVISNGQPEERWFKTERLRARLRQEVLPLIAEDPTPEYWQPAAFAVLSDSTLATATELPDTGIDKAIEHALSSIYIRTGEPRAKDGKNLLSNYGTRTQSILTLWRVLDAKPSTVDISACLISRET